MSHLVTEAFQSTAIGVLVVFFLAFEIWANAKHKRRRILERRLEPILAGRFDAAIESFLRLDRPEWISQPIELRARLGGYIACLSDGADCCDNPRLFRL